MPKLLAAIVVSCFSLAALASPTPSAPPVKFGQEVLPILAHQCFECHANGKRKGGLDLTSRASLLKGGENGAAIIVGNSAKSLLIQKVTTTSPDDRMPNKGDPLPPDEIASLRNWIDQGAIWDATVQAMPPKPDVKPHPVVLPAGQGNPIDRLLASYFIQHHTKADEVVDDRRFARRVFFDTIGLSPTPAELEAFANDSSPTKREDLAKSLLARNEDYAENWISMWADHLRSGTTFGIDGHDININGWLLASLRDNMPYDQFVRTLIDPGPNGPRGFIDGLKMRGVVVSSERTEIQAAQNISQVFLGTQLKCATCHDSFTSKWTQNELWGMASVFADAPMEISRCEIPTGRKAVAGFIFPELGSIDPKLDKVRRITRLAELVTNKEDGLFARTIVNRMWNRLMGRGLVEPIDNMESPAWDPDVLNWLADDLVAHHYDVKHLLGVIISSRAYQMPAMDDDEVKNGGPRDDIKFVFAGPRFRRITAEQYADAVCEIGKTYWKTVAPPPQGGWPTKPDPNNDAKSERAWTHIRSPLQESLGRPDRNNVTTIRDTDASTLQGLQILTGPDLNTVVGRLADRLINEERSGPGLDADTVIATVWTRALQRKPTAGELKLSHEILGAKMTKDSVTDFVWAIISLPEFQVLD